MSVHLKGGLLKAFSAEFAAARKVATGMLAQATDTQLHVIILLTLFEGSMALEAAAEVVGKDSRLLQGQLQVLYFPMLDHHSSMANLDYISALKCCSDGALCSSPSLVVQCRFICDSCIFSCMTCHSHG